MKDYLLLTLCVTVILSIFGVNPVRSLLVTIMAVATFYFLANAGITWMVRTCPVESCLPNILAACMFAGLGVLALII